MYLFIYLFIQEGVHYTTHRQVRGQLVGVGSLPPPCGPGLLGLVSSAWPGEAILPAPLGSFYMACLSVYVCSRVCMWKPEVGACCLPQSPSALFFEAGSLSGTRSQPTDMAGPTAYSEDPVSTFQALEL